MAFSYYMMDLLARHFFLGEDIPSPFFTKTPYLGLTLGVAFPGTDSWQEVAAADYQRQEFHWALDESGYVKLGTPVTFTASSDWSNVYGVVVYDEATKGTGNPIYDVPWTAADYSEVPFYHITSGCVCYLGEMSFIAGWRGKAPYADANGGISTQFSKAMIRWLFHVADIPYPRTYDIALGRYAHYASSDYGRFTGDWTECSGTGYTRIELAPGTWEAGDNYVRNQEEIVFTDYAGPNWGYVSDVILYAHSTQTPAFWGHLRNPRTISERQGFAIADTELNIYWGGNQI